MNYQVAARAFIAQMLRIQEPTYQQRVQFLGYEPTLEEDEALFNAITALQSKISEVLDPLQQRNQAA